MARSRMAGRRSGVKGMHGRHHTNTEPNPVGRPAGKLPFGQMYRPKKRRY
jgi:hypothetical protein